MSKGQTEDIHCKRGTQLSVIEEEGIVIWKVVSRVGALLAWAMATTMESTTKKCIARNIWLEHLTSATLTDRCAEESGVCLELWVPRSLQHTTSSLFRFAASPPVFLASPTANSGAAVVQWNYACFGVRGVSKRTGSNPVYDLPALILTLALAGKVCISGAYQIIYLYSSELFPTEVRMQGMGAASVFAQLASTIVPFIISVLGSALPWLPSLIFGVAGVVAGVFTVTLRETKDKPLPDTIADLSGTIITTTADTSIITSALENDA
ncbi:Solute carrier family 22 member 6 [Portunus trituberculatus]|uniref:Solute carrier family 22 member 6 n=1 Tax=Portunus trituberculatus TaxID=210409 RepID=A0A5B7CVW7_PORTR|nr:Solute carrier family 22 member 6 [Portunus trituberculatus]